MKRPGFLFRPNLHSEAHRKAWERLQKIPHRQKNAFIVQAILQAEQSEALETMLRRVLQEEGAMCSLQANEKKDAALPEGMLAFLDTLMEE